MERSLSQSELPELQGAPGLRRRFGKEFAIAVVTIVTLVATFAAGAQWQSSALPSVNEIEGAVRAQIWSGLEDPRRLDYQGLRSLAVPWFIGAPSRKIRVGDWDIGVLEETTEIAKDGILVLPSGEGMWFSGRGRNLSIHVGVKVVASPTSLLSVLRCRLGLP